MLTNRLGYLRPLTSTVLIMMSTSARITLQVLPTPGQVQVSIDRLAKDSCQYQGPGVTMTI